MAQYYSWEDVGAPYLDDSVGSFINLLNKVLVTGYGSKTSLGWDQPFGSSGGVAVFKVPNKNCYLRIDDGHTVSRYLYAKATGYASMTGLHTGVGEFPSKSNNGLGYSTWEYYCTINTTIPSSGIKWVICGDITYFHIFLDIDSGASTHFADASDENQILHLFFGFLKDGYTGDMTNCLISGSNNSTSEPTYRYHRNVFVGNDRWDNQGYLLSGLNTGITPISSTNNNNSIYYGDDVLHPLGKLFHYDFPIIEFQSRSGEDAPGRYTYRGMLPGLKRVAQEYSTLSSTYSNLDTLTLEDGKKYIILFIPNQVNYNGGSAYDVTTFLIECGAHTASTDHGLMGCGDWSMKSLQLPTPYLAMGTKSCYGYISGVVKDGETSVANAICRLYEQKNGLLVAEVLSASDGSFRFDDVSTETTYTAEFYLDDTYNKRVISNITPINPHI